MKLKNKIVLFTTMVCIISILFVSGVNYFFAITKLEDEINRKVEIEAEKISMDIDSWISTQKTVLSELINNMVTFDDFEHENVCDFLKAATERNPGNFYYGSLEGLPYLHPNRRVIDYDPTERVWYVGAEENEDFYIAEPYVDTETLNMVISISKAFETKDGRKGVLATDIQLDYLVDLISQVKISDDS